MAPEVKYVSSSTDPSDVKLSDGARRNSAVALAHEAGRRGSVIKASEDKDVLVKTKDALVKLAGTFDSNEHLLPAAAGDGIAAKYFINTGSMCLITHLPRIAAPVEKVVELMWEKREENLMRLFDGVYASAETRAQLNPEQKLMHMRYTKLGALKPRDVSILGTLFRGSGAEPTVLCFASCTTSAVPPVAGCVRADMHVQGYVIAPLDAESCSLTVATEIDLKVPKCMAKMMACLGKSKALILKSAANTNASFLRMKAELEPKPPVISGRTASLVVKKDGSFASNYADVDVPQVALTDYVLKNVADAKEGAVALLDGPSERAIQYAQLKPLIRSAASGLAERGFKQGDVLAGRHCLLRADPRVPARSDRLLEGAPRPTARRTPARPPTAHRTATHPPSSEGVRRR